MESGQMEEEEDPLDAYMRELNASCGEQVAQVEHDLSPGWRRTSGINAAGGGTNSIVRNRRYNKMLQLEKAGKFFSEEAMKARSPALFNQYLGEYATHLEGLAGAGYDKEQGPKLSDTFLQTIDREVAQGRQREEEQKWGIEPERSHPRPDCAQIFGVMSEKISQRQQMGQAYNAAEALPAPPPAPKPTTGHSAGQRTSCQDDFEVEFDSESDDEMTGDSGGRGDKEQAADVQMREESAEVVEKSVELGRGGSWASLGERGDQIMEVDAAEQAVQHAVEQHPVAQIEQQQQQQQDQQGGKQLVQQAKQQGGGFGRMRQVGGSQIKKQWQQEHRQNVRAPFDFDLQRQQVVVLLETKQREERDHQEELQQRQHARKDMLALLRGAMQRRFLQGGDTEFVDYAATDRDDSLDDVEQMNRDAQDRYFDQG
jgi:hypothetical protein